MGILLPGKVHLRSAIASPSRGRHLCAAETFTKRRSRHGSPTGFRFATEMAGPSLPRTCQDRYWQAGLANVLEIAQNSLTLNQRVAGSRPPTPYARAHRRANTTSRCAGLPRPLARAFGS